MIEVFFGQSMWQREYLEKVSVTSKSLPQGTYSSQVLESNIRPTLSWYFTEDVLDTSATEIPKELEEKLKEEK